MNSDVISAAASSYTRNVHIKLYFKAQSKKYFFFIEKFQSPGFKILTGLWSYQAACNAMGPQVVFVAGSKPCFKRKQCCHFRFNSCMNLEGGGKFLGDRQYKASANFYIFWEQVGGILVAILGNSWEAVRAEAFDQKCI